MRQKKRSFAVIGLGTFGSTVAAELARYGNHVLGIGIDERNVNALADTLAEVVIADGRDEEALRQAGVAKYDVVLVAIGEDLEANILCVMNAKALGVPTIWVKAMSLTHRRILAKLGADRVIQPEQEIGQHVAQMLHNPLVRDYLSLRNSHYVVYFQIPEQLQGERIGSLQLQERHNIHCLGVMRSSEYLPCADNGPELKEGDKILLLGRREDLRGFGETL